MDSRRVFYINNIENIFENSQTEGRAAKKIREQVDYVESYNETEFVQRFRVSKHTFQYILEKICHSIQSRSQRHYSVSPRTKLLITLRFYASGNFLITVGDFCGVSVSTAGRIVRETSSALAGLSNEYIKFPSDTRGMQQTAADFFTIAKFPKVIGAIDCTHIRIQSPGGNTGEIFRNRKGYFSFNVQAVCNAKLMFQDLVARWPGSAHDSNIFKNSRLKFRMEDGQFQNYVILGDSGYKQCKYMMIPLRNPHTRAENLYNESQIRTRNTIERCFGVWKRRFPVLSNGLRLTNDTKMAVIVACAVLHNITIMAKDPLPSTQELLEFQEESFSDNLIEQNNILSNCNSTARTNLIENYFAHLVQNSTGD